MANKTVFAPTTGRALPAADVLNREGAPAFAYGWEHMVAQLAVTGTFNDGFYGTGEAQLADIVAAATQVEPAFVAKAAVYAREHGYMKDAPALLLASLSLRDPALFRRVFNRVIDNGRMLRTFVQIMRSGVVGRRSLGSAPKRAIQAWLNDASDWQLISAAVGAAPSLADVIRMVHPKPVSAEREALFAWIIGKPCAVSLLPAAIQDYLRFKSSRGGPVPDVPFGMLTSLPLDSSHWAKIAERGTWQTVRMNLNTFARHGVFEHAATTAKIAATLADRGAVLAARAMPYQLMAAAGSLDRSVPDAVRAALVEAMEVAVANAPSIDGRVVVCPDVSWSMTSPITGHRRGATTVVRCLDVAALVAAAVLRANPLALVLPFDTSVYRPKLRASDTVLANAKALAGYGGGGTDCTAPLVRLNREAEPADLVVFVSDNQSWAHRGDGRTTPMMREWERFRRRNPGARLVCIDIAPYGSTQAASREDVLNVGGFSDAVFDVVARFSRGECGVDFWRNAVAEVEL